MKGGPGALEMMADHRCDRPTCSTCALFLTIPDSDTPEYAAWQAGLRAELLTDPLILGHCPDLVRWLLSLRDDDANN